MSCHWFSRFPEFVSWVLGTFRFWVVHDVDVFCAGDCDAVSRDVFVFLCDLHLHRGPFSTIFGVSMEFRVKWFLFDMDDFFR